MMNKKNPRVLFLLGASSWTSWLPSFLTHPDYTFDYHLLNAESEQDLVARGFSNDYHSIILLSHHRTLMRDLNLKCTLEQRGGPTVLAQPIDVVRLAYDKQAMAAHARTIPSLATIPQLALAEAINLLGSGKLRYVVAKRKDDTEGCGLRIFENAKQLETSAPNLSDHYMIQPFISGSEFSVNFACFDGRFLAFPPVWKGATTPTAVHPCKRVRFCPPKPHYDDLARRLIAASIEFLEALMPSGLVELEFISTDKDLYFLEFNPRLSATMRMVSVATNRSIFAELARATVGESLPNTVVHPVQHVGEFPLSINPQNDFFLQLESADDVWVSSRVTVAAKTRRELVKRMREIRSGLRTDSRDIKTGTSRSDAETNITVS